MFGRNAVRSEERGRAAVAWAQGASHHRYEDRYRLLTDGVPLVAEAGRGELVAVFDGMGGLRLGMHSAQAMADGLLRFYREPDRYPPSAAGVRAVLEAADAALRAEASAQGREVGCAGTVAWLREDGGLVLCHAGDTLGLLVDGDGYRVLTPTQPVEGPEANFFGTRRGVRVWVVEVAATCGDLVVLVSDGVTATLPPARIAALAREAPLPREAAERIARAALDRGTQDDVTALVFDLSSPLPFVKLHDISMLQ